MSILTHPGAPWRGCPECGVYLAPGLDITICSHPIRVFTPSLSLVLETVHLCVLSDDHVAKLSLQKAMQEKTDKEPPSSLQNPKSNVSSLWEGPENGF